MAQIALAAGMAMLCAAPAEAQQKFPPDIMAPAGTQPPAAPKPERSLPQSDQPAKSTQQRPAAPTPTAPAATQKSHKLVERKRITKPSPIPHSEPAPTPAAPPPPPPTPQQMPPQPPDVQYRDGLLTVSANNSTLSDVLNAIRAQSGATMTLPPNGLGDRLFVQVGPAPPRDVLSRLLAGTNFDYVLVGSPQDPDALKQVIVTARSPEGAAQNNPPGGYQPSRLPGMGAPEESEERPAPPPNQQPMPGGFGAPGGPGPFQPNRAVAPPSVANPTPMQATPGPTGIAPVQPPQMPPNQPPQMPPQGTQTGQPPQPKTPEQLLQELKQMQQQQQQQQQQQKPPR